MTSPADIHALHEQFAIPNAASIVPGQGGLAMISIQTPAAAAGIYLHGAQVTSWQPAGAREVLFLSQHSRWKDGCAIRGGIPICFPWFRAMAGNAAAPAHGVVRTRAWQLSTLAQSPAGVVATLVTESDDASRAWWPFDFRLEHRITIGKQLRLELIATNTGSSAFTFAEALHTYHAVSDVRRISVAGLAGAAYADNMDQNRKKMQLGNVLFSRATDNAYTSTRAALQLVDPGFKRSLQIDKKNSLSTVVWNPWEEGARAMADLGDDEWQHFACVEACNILGASIELAPGAAHTLAAAISATPHEPA